MPYWVGNDITDLELVRVNTLEYIIRDDIEYGRSPAYPFTTYIYSEVKTVVKKKGVDLSYSVISRKGRRGGTNVYACSEGDPLPLLEDLLNKRYKMGWSIKEDKPGSKVFYDHGLQP